MHQFNFVLVLKIQLFLIQNWGGKKKLIALESGLILRYERCMWYEWKFVFKLVLFPISTVVQAIQGIDFWFAVITELSMLEIWNCIKVGYSYVYILSVNICSMEKY